MRLISLLLLLALPAWAATPLDPGTHIVEPGDYTLSEGDYQITVEMAPPPPLEGWAWVEKPGTAMDSVKLPGDDHSSWVSMQGGWGHCVNAVTKLYCTGGGHADGWYNMYTTVDVDGNWERYTEPSPIWSEAQCPGGDCTTPEGLTCRFGYCGMMPDGTLGAAPRYQNSVYWGGYLYRIGMSTYTSGRIPDDRQSARIHLDSKTWEALPNHTKVSNKGISLVAGDTLYRYDRISHMTLSLPDHTWTKVKSSGLSYIWQSVGFYDEVTDRFYLFGRGRAQWQARTDFGGSWHHFESEPDMAQQSYIGVTQWGRYAILWAGGRDITLVNLDTEEWQVITPGGDDPGSRLSNGTFGRFTVLDGTIVLINGVSKNMFHLMPPGQQAVIEPRLLERPYYEAPPGDALVEAGCGPFADWETLDIREDSQVAQLKRLTQDDRVIARIHWKPEPYPEIQSKQAGCLKLEGVGKPTTVKINATQSRHNPREIGGLIIENMRVDMAGSGKSGDCVGVPQNKQFLIIRDSEVLNCKHHSLLAKTNYGLYLEITGSKFSGAKSHLVYTERVAYLYVRDSVFSNPGWGHGLRVIAGGSTLDNVYLTNAGEKLGMHPLEIMTCGGDHLAKNAHVEIARNENGNPIFGASFRNRRSIRGCDLHSHDGEQWSLMGPGNWGEWPNDHETRLVVDNYVCEGCVYDWDVKFSNPIMSQQERKAYNNYIKGNGPYDPLFQYALDHAANVNDVPEIIPLQPPEDWHERVVFEGEYRIRPVKGSNFCWNAECEPPRARLEM